MQTYIWRHIPSVFIFDCQGKHGFFIPGPILIGAEQLIRNKDTTQIKYVYLSYTQ